MTIRVFLADDQALLRATFKILIDATGDLTVVGEASTGDEAAERSRTSDADVVLMDIRMPDVDGIEATRRITADPDLAGVRVLILTTFETELVVDALHAGASGFLGKGVEPAALLDAIRTVHAGESLLSPLATKAVIERFLSHGSDPTPRLEVDSLTDREREITTLVAHGMSNDEIAERLFISPATPKTHVNRAMMKTSSRDRAQLVVYAYETHLVAPRG